MPVGVEAEVPDDADPRPVNVGKEALQLGPRHAHVIAAGPWARQGAAGVHRRRHDLV